ncbi:MAG: undecaprenyl/decaprenyl-phosphate alpha-N-acetylglucosaminyl 1-phosphate transferase [Betaproteobacteria bacterium]|nr:undecaprenyl/decaprenyl-phosphate alpha-N-acetylglucosaminyl 1-phosphate transferase [Betaproteobacteria bacterium]
MKEFGWSLLASLVTSLIVLRIAHIQQRWGFDDAFESHRKLHQNPVPRLGGAGIMVSIWFVASLLNHRQDPTGSWLLSVLLVCFPSFLVGLGEDLTGRFSPAVRLCGMVLSAWLVWMVLGIGIVRIDLPFSDFFLGLNQELIKNVSTWQTEEPSLALGFPFGGLLPWFFLTLLGLVTVTNGINLIDGLNGLASVSSITMLLGLGAVSFGVGDMLIASSAFLIAGSIAGFLVWNWPRGYLFLGDGGAYLLGSLLGVLSIALVQRNPSVSAWFAVLLLAYPLTEVAFSVWRRRLVKGRPAGLPDATHLHHLVYRRIVRLTLGKNPSESKMMRNAFAAPYLWIMNCFAVFPAVAFYDQPHLLIIGLLIFIGSYLWFYLRIVRLKVPKPLIVRETVKQSALR